jgi:hypothetical protein
MNIFVRLGMLCLICSLTLGCGGGAVAPPSQEEIDKNNAAMENDMKTMMQQVPRVPK